MVEGKSANLDPKEDTRTRLARYFGLSGEEIAHQIAEHKYFINLSVPTEIPEEEAFESWNQNVFLPLISAIEDSGLENDFPLLGIDELFIRVSDHWYYLKREKDPRITAENAVLSFGSLFTENALCRLKYFDKLVPGQETK